MRDTLVNLGQAVDRGGKNVRFLGDLQQLHSDLITKHLQRVYSRDEFVFISNKIVAAIARLEGARL